MSIKVNIEVITHTSQHDHDEVWHGEIIINNATYSWYANPDMILINGSQIDWPNGINEIHSAIIYCAIKQFSDMLDG